MANAQMSSHFDVAPDTLWDLIGGFNALADWHALVAKSELEERGIIRRLTSNGWRRNRRKTAAI